MDIDNFFSYMAAVSYTAHYDSLLHKNHNDFLYYDHDLKKIYIIACDLDRTIGAISKKEFDKFGDASKWSIYKKANSFYFPAQSKYNIFYDHKNKNKYIKKLIKIIDKNKNIETIITKYYNLIKESIFVDTYKGYDWGIKTMNESNKCWEQSYHGFCKNWNVHNRLLPKKGLYGYFNKRNNHIIKEIKNANKHVNIN